jgi:hypothetical protein
MNAKIRPNENATEYESERRTSFLSRRGMLTATIIVLLTLLGVYLFPLLQTHPEQDACSFGPISNERYRALLAEAKRRHASTWPPIVWDKDKTDAALNARFDDLSRGMTSVYERLAAMHAVMRAIGGDYRQSGAGLAEPFAKAVAGAGIMPYEYHVDLNRLGMFFPIRRQLVVHVSLIVQDYAGLAQDKSRANRGDIQFGVRFPMLLEDYHLIDRSPFGESCPATPDPELAQTLSRP